MKIIHWLLTLSVLCSVSAVSQTVSENLIIVTTDGFRWEEVFGGMDSAIAKMPEFNLNQKKRLDEQYGGVTSEERRKKLLPFIWTTMAANGQIYGNRAYKNDVNNANPYWFSYPGYSEIFCGFVDTAINSNGYKPNPNTNVLEYIQKQPGFQGKVAAFGAWDAFDRILNETRCGFPVICGQDSCGGSSPDAEQQLINAMKKDCYNPYDASEQLDVFTHYAAMDYLKKKAPRVLYISYGETDEWAHEGHYADYLDAAHRVDKWLNDLWQYIQSNPQYKNKTTLLITVDHGRGDTHKKDWTSHNAKIARSNEIWFAVMGPGFAPTGEVKTAQQLFQKQFAQTFANILGLTFSCEHSVAPAIELPLKK